MSQPLPQPDDPLEEVLFSDVLKYGDPSNWKYLGHKQGSPAPAKSHTAPPGTMKIMEVYESEYRDCFELHYFRYPDGSVGNVKAIP